MTLLIYLVGWIIFIGGVALGFDDAARLSAHHRDRGRHPVRHRGHHRSDARSQSRPVLARRACCERVRRERPTATQRQSPPTATRAPSAPIVPSVEPHCDDEQRVTALAR
ncbi:hypothetical protein [Burkholderia cenocepacia]